MHNITLTREFAVSLTAEPNAYTRSAATTSTHSGFPYLARAVSFCSATSQRRHSPTPNRSLFSTPTNYSAPSASTPKTTHSHANSPEPLTASSTFA